jgi:H+/gluconate symporter-like permease
MDDVFDIVWLKILVLVHAVAKVLNFLFAPLNLLGPAVAILVIVVLTVASTKFLSRIYKTKRYLKLQKEFQDLYNLRNEALTCQDPEKGKALAKNIDQARLNQVYYDYFFEGLLNSIPTKYLPILIMLAYVNETFKPKNLLENFGRDYILKFVSSNGNAVKIGAVFWFVLSMLMVYLAWFVIGKLVDKYKKK